MLSRLNPDVVKQAVKTAAAQEIDQFKDDLLWQRHMNWFAAAVATGAAKEYRLRLVQLLNAWREPTDHDIVVAIKDSLTKVRDADSQASASLVDWTHAPPGNDRDAARAVATVENRMALHLAMRGLQWALDLRHRSRAVSSESEGPDLAITSFARELSALDERLHRKLIALSSAVHTDTLVAMRSLMRPRDFLPWWLDGTLETVAAAQTVNDDKRAMLNAVLERDPADDNFLRMLVPAIEGPRATIGEPTDHTVVNRSRFDVYAWTLPEGDGVPPTRVELLVPAIGSRRATLELRVGEPVGATAARRGGDGDPDELRPDYGFLVGRAMLLNGIVFLWFRSGGKVTAKVTMGASPPLPFRGQMQLFDCTTNRVLEPA